MAAEVHRGNTRIGEIEGLAGSKRQGGRELSESGWAFEGGQAAIDSFVQAESPAKPARALVVGTPAEVAGTLASCLAGAGFAVRTCPDGQAALESFVRELPDLIVTQDRLAGFDGLELAERVRELSDVPLVLVASTDEPEQRDRALRLGVDHVLTGPEEHAILPRLAAELARPIRPSRRPRLTAAHVRRVARSALQAELARLLVECRGNLAEMARRMGRDRSTVRYHLRRFGMLVEETGEGRSEGEGPVCIAGGSPAA